MINAFRLLALFCFVFSSGCFKQVEPATSTTPPSTYVDRLEALGVARLEQPGYVQVENNTFGTCGLLRNGGIRCWGRDSLELPGDFIGISGTCFLKRSGEVVCANPKRQPLPANYSYQQIAVSAHFACGITEDAHLVCQVDADHPELQSIATVHSEHLYTQVVVGDSNACAITRASQTVCWGTDYSDGVNRATPVGSQLVLMTLAMAGDGMQDITCAVDTNGDVYCLESRTKKLHALIFPRSRSVSIGVGGLDNPTICVITVVGEAKCVGNDLIDMQGPVGAPWVQVSAGGRHVCAVNRDGGVVCGGFNTANRNNIPWYDETNPALREEEF